MQVAANVDGSSFYEVTFYAKVGDGEWRPIGTDDTAPYRVFHDVSPLDPGTPLEYRAVILDNGRHTATSEPQSTAVPAPLVTIEAPREGSGARGIVEVRAVADPERATHVVTGSSAAWPAGHGLRSGATTLRPFTPYSTTWRRWNWRRTQRFEYRAILTTQNGTTVTSAVRTIRAAGPTPATMATLRYFRPSGDYGDPPASGWGLHMWGDAVDPAVLAQIAWDKPWPRSRVEDGWAVYEIPLITDEKNRSTSSCTCRAATQSQRPASQAVTGRSCPSTTRLSGSSRVTRRSIPANLPPHRSAGPQPN